MHPNYTKNTFKLDLFKSIFGVFLGNHLLIKNLFHSLLNYALFLSILSSLLFLSISLYEILFNLVLKNLCFVLEKRSKIWKWKLIGVGSRAWGALESLLHVWINQTNHSQPPRYVHSHFSHTRNSNYYHYTGLTNTIHDLNAA